MDIRIVDPGLNPQWNELILNNFDPDIFHSAEWCQVLKSSYKLRPIYFVASEARKPVAIIPLAEARSSLTGNRGVSLPFSDYCHFLESNEDSWHSLLEPILTYGRKMKWKYCEFRSLKFISDATPSEMFYTHDLDLTRPTDILWANLKNSCRRNIKKASREGVKIRFDKSWPGLEQFYRLQVMTRKRHGLPPQPLIFFKNLYENIISKNLGIIASAYSQHKIIASSIYLNFNHKALFKYGASDARYHHLRPNNLMMWEAINWHRENNCRQMNLGRTERDNTGLLNYKRQWGGKEYCLNYHRFDFEIGSYAKNMERQLMAFWPSQLARLLPDCLFKFSGKILYKHIS